MFGLMRVKTHIDTLDRIIDKQEATLELKEKSCKALSELNELVIQDHDRVRAELTKMQEDRDIWRRLYQEEMKVKVE